MPRSQTLLSQWTLYDSRDYDAAFKQALELAPQLQGADLRDAQRLLGLASLRQQQYTQARLWLRKASQESDEAQDWLHLALCASFLNDWPLAEASFEQVRLIQQTARYAQEPGFYHQLLWYATSLCERGAYSRSQPLLEELAAAYCRVHTADTSQLYVLRLPFLSSFLTLVERRYDEAGEHAEGVRWLWALSEGLDHEGRKQVQESMKQLREAGGLAPGEEQ